MTEEEYAAFIERGKARAATAPEPQKKPSKYHNKKVQTEDGTFDSKWELTCWQRLKMMERGGAISGLQRQVVFELIPSAILDTRKLPAVKYVADFVYQKDGQQVVEDAKGGESLPEYKLKRRLMWWIHKIKVVEVRKP